MDKIKERYSNFELLRIVAMILVLIVHILICLPRPTTAFVIAEPFKAISFYFTDAISIICVNVFILISGWFGINLRLQRLSILLFQVFFFAIVIWGVLVFIEPSKYMNLQSLTTVLMLNGSDYWFIKAYLGLYFLSPILNVFVEKVDQKYYRDILILLYIFQTIYGWFSIDGAAWIAGGYSAFSFICLYLLGRYLKKYGDTINVGRYFRICSLSKGNLLLLFSSIVFLLTFLAYTVTYLGIPIEGRLFTYTNPLVILESIVLVLLFSKIKFKSSIINRIAFSCLAIYLLHGNELILRPYYGKWIAQWYSCETTTSFVMRTSFLIFVVFIMAISLDQIRLVLSKIIFSKSKCV